MLAPQMIWKKETGRLSEEKEILSALENDLSLLDKDIEEVRHWTDEICHSPKPTTLN
jgi:hypothetical protein